MKRNSISKLIIAVATTTTLFISAGSIINTAYEQGKELNIEAQAQSEETTDPTFITPEPYTDPTHASLASGSITKSKTDGWVVDRLSFTDVNFPTQPSATASDQTTYVYIKQGSSTELARWQTKFVPFQSPIDDNWYWSEDEPYGENGVTRAIPVTDPYDVWVYLGSYKVGKMTVNETDPSATLSNTTIDSNEYSTDFKIDLGTSESVDKVRLLDSSGKEVPGAVTYDAENKKGTIKISGLKYSTDYTYNLEITHTDLTSTPNQIAKQKISFTTEDLSASKPTTDGSTSLVVDPSKVVFNEATGAITVDASWTADIKTQSEFDQQGVYADSLPTNLKSVSIVDRNDDDKVLATQNIDNSVNVNGDGKIEGTFESIDLPGKSSVKLALQFTYDGGSKKFIDDSTTTAAFDTPSRGSAKIVPYIHLETDEDSEEYLMDEWHVGKQQGPLNMYKSTTGEYYTKAYVRARVELVGYYDDYIDITEYDVPTITSTSLISYTDEDKVNYITNATLPTENIDENYNTPLQEAVNSDTYKPGDKVAAYTTFSLVQPPSSAGAQNGALTPNTTYDLRYKLETDSNRTEQQSFVAETSTGEFTTPDIGGYEPSISNFGMTEGKITIDDSKEAVYNNKFAFDIDAQTDDQLDPSGNASMYTQSNIQTLELTIFDGSTTIHTEDLTDLLEPNKTHYVTTEPVEILKPDGEYSFQIDGTYLTHPYDDPTDVIVEDFTSGKITKTVDGLGKEELKLEEDLTIDKSKTKATLTSFKTSFTINNVNADPNYESYRLESVEITDPEGNQIPSENIKWSFETPLTNVDLAKGELYNNTISFSISGLEPGTNVLDYKIKITTDSNNALVNLTDEELDSLGLEGTVDYDELRREFTDSYECELGEFLSYADGVVTEGDSGWELSGDDGTSVISATDPVISIDYTEEEYLQEDSEIGVEVIDPKSDLMNVTFRLNVEDPSQMFSIGTTSDPISETIPVVDFNDYFKLYSGEDEYSTTKGNLSIAIDETPVGDESYLITLKNVYGNQTLDSFSVDYISYDQEYSDEVDSHTYSITKGQSVSGSIELPDIQGTTNERPKIVYALPDSAKYKVKAKSTDDVKLNYEIKANPTVTLRNKPDYLYFQIAKEGEFLSSAPTRSSEVVQFPLESLNGTIDLTDYYTFEKKERYEVKLYSYGFIVHEATEDSEEEVKNVTIVDNSTLNFRVPGNFPWWILILLLLTIAGIAIIILLWIFRSKYEVTGVQDVEKGKVTAITNGDEDFLKEVKGRKLRGSQSEHLVDFDYSLSLSDSDEVLITFNNIDNKKPITNLVFIADQVKNDELLSKYENDKMIREMDDEISKGLQKEVKQDKLEKPKLSKDIKVIGKVETEILLPYNKDKLPQTLAGAQQVVKSLKREVQNLKAKIKSTDKVIDKNETPAKVKNAIHEKGQAEIRLLHTSDDLKHMQALVKEIKKAGTATARRIN